MSEKDQPPQEKSTPDQGDRDNGSQRHPHKPWRTEGLPTAQGNGDKPRRPRWWRWAAWIVGGYLVLFLITTMQDQMSGGEQTVAYTERQPSYGGDHLKPFCFQVRPQRGCERW